ncbi:hypothetical protein [Nostoc sp. FACHB-110]|uniref:hypothetical protein n=1 Tax=Nostoc sp. FACHB-110 TaxID=2692834 RepID=UPI0016867D60|nr:hypothetical protein [Nostoc sp. FACHB-110]MBD2439007.1 hypothetical protein [Nostoc sp. FACHB-110]
MRIPYISALLGLTGMLALQTFLPAQAATFDLSKLKNIKARPIESDTRLDLLGLPIEQQGYTAFFNPNPLALDNGHDDISLNASGNGAPYYVTGRQSSPEEPASGSTKTSTVTAIAGFPTLSNYLASNGISFDSLGFGFGQKNYNEFTKTWNLGEDKLGQDWFASQDSTVEERIYKANPNDVEAFLTFGTQKIVSLGYFDIYTALDYGATKSPFDDIETAFTDLVKGTKVNGLDPLADGLATALLKDVADAGDYLQVVILDTAPDDTNITQGNDFIAINLRFLGSVRVARLVPENSPALGLLVFGALYLTPQLKKVKLKIKQ